MQNEHYNERTSYLTYTFTEVATTPEGTSGAELFPAQRAVVQGGALVSDMGERTLTFSYCIAQEKIMQTFFLP